MPSRWISILIVIFWGATMVRLTTQRLFPSLAPGQPPSFITGLPDEVAPQYSSWTIFRGDKKVGSADTRMTPRKAGDFELQTRIRQFEMSLGPVSLLDAKLPLVEITRVVNRDGDLQSLSAKATIQASSKLLKLNLQADMKLLGDVQDDHFVGTCDLTAPFGTVHRQLDPIPLKSKRAMSPLEPMHRFPPLQPGQEWTETHVDPVMSAMTEALMQAVQEWIDKEANGVKLPFKRLPTGKAVELSVTVRNSTETISYRDKEYVCQVIEYVGRELRATTWVEKSTGKVIRQTAEQSGEKLTMQRE